MTISLLTELHGLRQNYPYANGMGIVLSEETVKHFTGYGPHRCRRGHAFKIKFETGAHGITTGYLKVCSHCGKEEIRELTKRDNRVVSQSVPIEKQD